MKIEHEELQEMVKKHELWLEGNIGGERLDLSHADLRGVELSEINLRGAFLHGVNLVGADLGRTDLSGASLSGANLDGAYLAFANLANASLSRVSLRQANLEYANLFEADLAYADLNGADLRWANLTNSELAKAKLTNAELNESTAFYHLQCPEEGSFIGFKKCRDDLIVKLLIPEDAKRSSATSRKCRCSKATVLSITDYAGAELKEAVSMRNSEFVYHVGETLEVPDFDENRWEECSNGIHFFITKQEAIDYEF